MKLIQPGNDSFEEMMQLRKKVEELQLKIAKLEVREPVIKRKEEVLHQRVGLDEIRMKLAKQDGVLGLIKLVGAFIILYFIVIILKPRT